VKPKEGGFLLVSPFNHLDGIWKKVIFI
jgi:hypothetical protein